MNDDREPETKTFRLLLSDLGARPIKVSAGSKIHIKLKSRNEESRRCHYGYDDRSYDYRKIDDQPLDFEIERSNYDDNGSRVDFGQIPYILYN